MKYKCDMVKDLMPLCLDHAATESSEKAVVEHLAECKKCTHYYESLCKEIKPMGGPDENNKYVRLAAKIRKRKLGIGLLIFVSCWIFCFACLNYASGYRWDSKAAADISGRLNYKSEMLASYEWREDYHFYIYDSYSCYDVIGVEKSWNGWKKTDNCLNWPKWSMYNEDIGIETAGDLCHFRYNEGVQLFPIISYDSNVKTVEVTCYEQTQIKDVTPGDLTLFVFDAIFEQPNTVEAVAYDAMGNIIYRLDTQGNLLIWVPVE